ncbi:MAG: hypothetical protein VYA56_06430, partial [Actinomycetota bacterium]|nr:hypothetical protein [Actinomycetota bacterium]
MLLCLFDLACDLLLCIAFVCEGVHDLECIGSARQDLGVARLRFRCALSGCSAWVGVAAAACGGCGCCLASA